VRRLQDAVIAGGHPLPHRGLGEQVAGKLLDREPVEGQVAVEGVDHPVAVGPDLAEVVDVNAVRIGVAGRVEPLKDHALPVARRGEQTVHQAFVSGGCAVVDESVDFSRRRRQAVQIEGEPADQRPPVGFG
jgi:hypothetical protein